MPSAYDVPADKLIEKIAEELKKNPEIHWLILDWTLPMSVRGQPGSV